MVTLLLGEWGLTQHSFSGVHSRGHSKGTDLSFSVNYDFMKFGDPEFNPVFADKIKGCI